MSRLCRLRNFKHGEDGQWAYREITTLRRELAEARQEIADRKADCETGHDQDEATIAELRQQLKHMTDQYNAALEAEQVRYRQVVEKDAEIERLKGYFTGLLEEQRLVLAASQAREQQLREGIEAIQDYAQDVIDRRVYEYGEDFRPLQLKAMRDDLAKAQKAIALPQDTTALESMIAKAGEVMRERTHSAMLDLKPWDHRGEIIRAIPAVTIDDLKC